MPTRPGSMLRATSGLPPHCTTRSHRRARSGGADRRAVCPGFFGCAILGGLVCMASIATDSYLEDAPRAQDGRTGAWVRKYLRLVALGDFGCASAAALAAVVLRFGDNAG